MFNLKSMLRTPYGYYDYIWIDCTLIKETPKAILIDFDNRRIWLPKAWIIGTKRFRHCEERSDEAISIRISQYNWAKKAQ